MKRHAKKQLATTITARQPTIAIVVASRLTPGTVDHVHRVLDPILALFRSGRISRAQYDAAERYRSAFDAVRAGARSVDLTRIGGGSTGSRTPAPATFDAALRLREATRVLDAVPVPPGGQVSVAVVVEMIAGQGWSVESAAAAIHGAGADGRASGRNRTMVANMLRAGLDAL